MKTNNQAESLAMLRLLVEAYINGVDKIKIFGDSQVLINCVTGKNNPKNANLIRTVAFAKDMEKHFKLLEFRHISRVYNMKANQIAQDAFSKAEETVEH